MKNNHYKKRINIFLYSFMVFLFISHHDNILASSFFQEPVVQDIQRTKEFKGRVLDAKTNDPLAYADINISETNIGTITNNEGKFSLKVPVNYLDKTIIISLLGYKKIEIPISELKKENIKILLYASLTELDFINVYGAKNAESLVRATLDRKSKYYDNDNTIMTAFYRETIKKRNRNASLSETLLNIINLDND